MSTNIRYRKVKVAGPSGFPFSVYLLSKAFLDGARSISLNRLTEQTTNMKNDLWRMLGTPCRAIMHLGIARPPPEHPTLFLPEYT